MRSRRKEGRVGGNIIWKRSHLRAHNRLAHWLGLGHGFDIEEGGLRLCCGLSPNQIVLNYLRWSFRASFAAVFLSAALGFLGATMLFAFLIWRIGVRVRTFSFFFFSLTLDYGTTHRLIAHVKILLCSFSTMA